MMRLMMRQLTPGRLRAPDCALSLWATLRLMLATYPTEPTQVQLGVWSAVWGLSLLLPAHTFGLAPHAYAWMRPVPGWAWGLVWVAKGAWQVRAALTLARARIFWLPGLGRAQGQCLLAARVSVTLAVTLAAGFAAALGPLNVYVAFYAWQAVLQAWVLGRAFEEIRASREIHGPDARRAGGGHSCPP